MIIIIAIVIKSMIFTNNDNYTLNYKIQRFLLRKCETTYFQYDLVLKHFSNHHCRFNLAIIWIITLIITAQNVEISLKSMQFKLGRELNSRDFLYSLRSSTNVYPKSRRYLQKWEQRQLSKHYDQEHTQEMGVGCCTLCPISHKEKFISYQIDYLISFLILTSGEGKYLFCLNQVLYANPLSYSNKL